MKTLTALSTCSCLFATAISSTALLASVTPCNAFAFSASKAITKSPLSRSVRAVNIGPLFGIDPESSSSEGPPDDDEKATATDSSSSNRYDVSKLVSNPDDGAGFNQFDPVLKATGFLSRRFGIVGGLAIFAALFAVEGGEILKSFNDREPAAGDGVTRTTASGLGITEFLIGKGGGTPLPGSIVGLNAVVRIGDKTIFDTTKGDGKPVAFKLGQRPFQNVICEGVEEGIKGMKVGGKRRLDVPQGMGPPGVDLPPGVPLTYEVELTEVLAGYF